MVDFVIQSAHTIATICGIALAVIPGTVVVPILFLLRHVHRDKPSVL
jgi:hypothetical protein